MLKGTLNLIGMLNIFINNIYSESDCLGYRDFKMYNLSINFNIALNIDNIRQDTINNTK